MSSVPVAFDAKVIVTSVANLLVGATAARGVGPLDPLDPPELHREELRHAAAFLSERGLHAEYNVALGDPADEIVDLAESHKADLIVVGTREALRELAASASIEAALAKIAPRLTAPTDKADKPLVRHQLHEGTVAPLEAAVARLGMQMPDPPQLFGAARR